MNDIVHMLKEFTPGAWGIWTGVMMMAAWYGRQTYLDRKLSADDRLARREGYEAQVQMLMAENRALLKDISDLRREYDDHRKLCQVETDQLRSMVIDLEHEVAGLKRERAVDVIQDIKASANRARQ